MTSVPSSHCPPAPRSRVLGWGCLLLLVGAGCTGDGGGGGGGEDIRYVVHLQPLVPTNQAPFADLGSLQLQIVPTVGAPTTVDLPVPDSGGTTVAEELPAIEDAVLTVRGYKGDTLVAWGQTVPWTVGNTDEVDITILVSFIEAVGWLNPMDDGVYGGELIAVGDGRFRIFGGLGQTERDNLGEKRDRVLEVDVGRPDAALAFVDIGTLPEWAEGDSDEEVSTVHTERTDFRMLPLTRGDGAGQWLLAGGSYKGMCEDATSVTNTAYIYDVEAGTYTPTAGRMKSGREDYAAVVDERGHVIFQGGSVYKNDPGQCWITPSLEWYDPSTGLFEAYSSSAGEGLGQIGAIAASLGPDGSLFCGGADFNASGWTSVTACVTVDLDNALRDSESLPVSLAGAAAVQLDDGRVLVTGGANEDEGVSQGSASARAVDTAMLYSAASGWSTLPDAMRLPRAGHRMALLPDGRVAIIGGSATWDPFVPSDDAYSCVEIYDPRADADPFTMLDGCDADAAARGLPVRTDRPLVAVDPDFGVLIAGGAEDSNLASSQVSLFVPEP